ncbi:GA module-containing protein [Weissella confusa]|uniref:GA module-containing protein n=1 Tax=Weissella confusa TaxID=1583 RepID=A0A923SSS7_WEICO|nr:GA module-containing protein [Weissella confusa]
MKQTIWTLPLPNAVGDQMISSNGDASGASNPYVATNGASRQGQAIDDRIVYNGSSKEVTDGQIESQETDEQTEQTVAVDTAINVATNDESTNNVVAAPLPLSNAQAATVGTATESTDTPIWNDNGLQNNVITPAGETATSYLTNLSASLVSSFSSEASDSDTVAEVEEVVEEATAANEQPEPEQTAESDSVPTSNAATTTNYQKDEPAELAQQQATAETQIDEMAYLSDDEKASYKDRVVNATTSDEVTTIIDEAEATNLANAKEWAHDEISPENVADIVPIVTDATNQNLANAKTDAVAEIDDLQHLADDKKQSFVDQISNADTVSAVEQIVANAKL